MCPQYNSVFLIEVSLVVNLASECGFTDKHYTGLVRLQRILGKNGKFNVLGFPCNQFGGQEPKVWAMNVLFYTEQLDVVLPIDILIILKSHQS